jgi:hypothetical protein
MRNAGAKVLLEEISLLNRIAKFKDINLARTRVASVPEVGVFWVDTATGKVYADKSPLNDADDVGTAKIHTRGHYDVWRQVQVKNPKWKGSEYEDVPRGRVVYFKDPQNPKFIVYTNKILGKSKFMKAIAAEFNLPYGYYDFDFTDDHYVLPE